MSSSHTVYKLTLEQVVVMPRIPKDSGSNIGPGAGCLGSFMKVLSSLKILGLIV